MSYSPFQPRVLPLMIYYIILSIFGVVMTIKMLLKWRERKVTAPLLLSIVFLFLTLAIITLAIGLLEAAITGFYKEIYRISLPLAYGFVIIADIFLFKFITHVTGKGNKALLPIIIIGVIIIVVLFHPYNFWGVPFEDYDQSLSIRLYTNIGFTIYSIFIYLIMVSISYKARKIARDNITRTGMSLLLFSIISLILCLIMIIADNIMITIFSHRGYSEFMYIAWAFAMLFAFLIYMSLIMPSWLVKWIEKSNTTK